MQKQLHASIIALLMTPAAYADERLDQDACGKVKSAVELFLGLADIDFKESERLRKDGDSMLADEKFKQAFAMSELASNYSAVHSAFCKP